MLFYEAARCRNPEKTIAAAGKLPAGRIVYISDSPERTESDLALLTRSGYTVQKARSVDTMPFAEQAEMICLLSRV